MDLVTEMPPSLEAAIATEPVWLQLWIGLLVITHLAAALFFVHRDERGLAMRVEPIGIVGSFFVASLLMGWLYGEVGYVRLLGLAHLVCWGPVWVWVGMRRRAIGTGTLYGKYVHAYLLIAGISLVIDAIDVVRYFLGDGALLHRWS